MAFEKGKSGNPSGRPKKLLPDGRSLSDIAKLHTDIAIQTLSDIMRDEGAPQAARVSAANSLLDRGWGKPRQEMDVEHSGSVEATTKEQRDAAVAAAVMADK